MSADSSDRNSSEEASEIGETSVITNETGGTDHDVGRLIEECNKKAYLDGIYFKVDCEKSKSANNIIAKCQLCVSKEKFIKGSLFAASNFTTHLKRVHPDAYKEYINYNNAKKARLKDDAKSKESTVSCTFNQISFDRNVMNYIINRMAPLSTVEMESFRKIFDDLHIKGLKHQSRSTTTRKFQNVYQEFLTQTKRKLSTINYVCTTADVWSSSCRRFMGVTFHWIDAKSFNRESVAVACRSFPGSHTADQVASLLLEINNQFDLKVDKIVATTTDNGSNFVKAFREFGIDTVTENNTDDIQENGNNDGFEELEEDYSYVNVDGLRLPRHVRCASHTIHLIASRDTLKAIENSSSLSRIHFRVMTRCNALWAVLRSPLKREKLQEILGVCLSRPVSVRWNSMFDALEQILQLKENILQASEQLQLDSLRETDFEYVMEYVKCMKPLAKAIDILQGETKCYYGILVPTLLSLKNQLQQIEVNDLSFCSSLVSATITSLHTRFADYFDVNGEGCRAVVASLTHPYFKGRWMCWVPENKHDKIKKCIFDAAIAEQKPIANPLVSLQEPVEDDATFFNFESETNYFVQETSLPFSNASVEVEVLRYLGEPTTCIV